MRSVFKLSSVAVLLFTCMQGVVNAQDDVVKSEVETFRIETITEEMNVPWSMTFLSPEKAIVTERDAANLYVLDIKSGARTLVEGLPSIFSSSELSAGVFDVKAHPEYAVNGWIYIVYSIGDADSSGLVVDRFKLNENIIESRERLFEVTPKIAGKWHYGGRLVLTNGYMYLSTGDGYDFIDHAQDLTTHTAKILRLYDDGRIPDDNPFAARDEALPEIWVYGLRNPQGMALQPKTGALWWNEHGPQGGDEVNVAVPGRNYGWPIITYGEEYGGGPIGEGLFKKEGMQQPMYYWTPSIAPSGMMFYSADQFPKWNGNAFSGALALTHINRLVIENERVIHEERLLDDRGWRVRFVEQGPDGHIYFGVDDGMIMRLVPAE